MTTEAEAIANAAEVYGAILADPERREQLRRHRAERAQTSAQPAHPVRAGRRTTGGRS